MRHHPLIPILVTIKERSAAFEAKLSGSRTRRALVYAVGTCVSPEEALRSWVAGVVGEFVKIEENAADTHLRTMSMALMDEFMTCVHESNCMDIQTLLAFQRSWVDAKITKLEQEAELSADLVFLDKGCRGMDLDEVLLEEEGGHLA